MDKWRNINATALYHSKFIIIIVIIMLFYHVVLKFMFFIINNDHHYQVGYVDDPYNVDLIPMNKVRFTGNLASAGLYTSDEGPCLEILIEVGLRYGLTQILGIQSTWWSLTVAFHTTSNH